MICSTFSPRKARWKYISPPVSRICFLIAPYFPKDLLDKINKGIEAKYPADRKPGETDVQFYYRNRKRSFGDFKQEIWDIPQPTLDKIFAEN